MERMRNGQLITNPTDVRDYNGKIENYMKNHPEIFKQLEKTFGINQKTGQASSSDEGKLVTINGNHVLIKD